jgi:5'-deoxynucleotidase YfbR-like HD superfamily hydrolase
MLTTYTWRTVNPLNLHEEDINIEDIAHSLACTNRFAGHARNPISVAQHSVYVAKLCRGMKCELQALLHDAYEAYGGDITKWLKHTPEFAGYREAEDRGQRLIFRVFGCEEEQHPAVEMADRLMVRFEVTQAFYPDFIINHPEYEELTKEERALIGEWQSWNWKYAKSQFLSVYQQITGRWFEDAAKPVFRTT